MTEVRCVKCGYKWKPKSRLIKITCPSCRKITPNTSISGDQDGD